MDIKKIEELTKDECSKYINLGLSQVTKEPELAHAKYDTYMRTPKIYCFIFLLYDIETRTELPIHVKHNFDVLDYYDYITGEVEDAFKHVIIELLHRVNHYIEENYHQRIVLKSEISLTQESDIMKKLQYAKDLFEYNENDKALSMINSIYFSIKSL